MSVDSAIDVSHDAHPNDIATIGTTKCRSQHVERYWHLQSAFSSAGLGMWKGESFFVWSDFLLRGQGRVWDLRLCPWLVREDKKVQPIGKQQLLTSDRELQVPLFLDQMDGVVKPLQHTLFLNVRMCDEVMRLH
jgi:hypothetical protein